MVHNGIEYAEMQLLAEVYFVLKSSGKSPHEISLILESWKSKANSYLLEITIEILRKKEGDNWLIDNILDASGNKGTGNWATVASAELGMPSTMISSALFARYISSFKERRKAISEKYPKLSTNSVDIANDNLFSAYQFGRLMNHSQGFLLLKQSSSSFNWNLNLSEIARIWTNGCIIRSNLMETLVTILEHSEDILLETSVISQIKNLYPNTKEVLTKCIIHEIPIPCLSEAVNYFNGYKTLYSSANLIQAQRDYFGAHTYQKIDDPTGKFFHTNWKKAQTN
jgi:6-phosphogluconate dehydrogenase